MFYQCEAHRSLKEHTSVRNGLSTDPLVRDFLQGEASTGSWCGSWQGRESADAKPPSRLEPPLGANSNPTHELGIPGVAERLAEGWDRGSAGGVRGQFLRVFFIFSGRPEGASSGRSTCPEQLFIARPACFGPPPGPYPCGDTGD